MILQHEHAVDISSAYLLHQNLVESVSDLFVKELSKRI